MYGRTNMNPYGDRITEAEARALVRYMRSLAPEDIPAPEINDSTHEINNSTPETNDSAEVLQ